MSNKDDEKPTDTLRATEKPHEAAQEDPLADIRGLLSPQIPAGVDRRQFPDPKRCGRCGRGDDGLRCLGHR